MLEVKHLRLVRAVAEHGTLTRAAKSLFLTQSALSHQLLTLEKRVGAPLFHREGKRMTPTSAGARLLEAAARVLMDLAGVEEELRRLALGRQVFIRLSTECYTSYAWLPRAVQAFSRMNPSVEVQIVADATTNALQALLDGRVDVALVYAGGEDARLESVPLFEDELVALVREEHALAGRAFLEAEDFADAHLLLYSDLSESTVYQQVLEPACVRPRRVSQVQLTEAVVEMARAGLGIAVLARWAVEQHVGRGLVAVPLTALGVRRPWRGLLRRGDPGAAHIRAFLRHVAAGPRAEETGVTSAA